MIPGHVELGAEAESEREAEEQHSAAAIAPFGHLDKAKHQQVGNRGEGQVHDVDDGDARIDQKKAVGEREDGGQRGGESGAEHAAAEHVSDARQEGAHGGDAEPPRPRKIAEELDTDGDEDFGQRRMRIEEALAMKIAAGLSDEVDFIEDQLVGMVEIPEAQGRSHHHQQQDQ